MKHEDRMTDTTSSLCFHFMYFEQRTHETGVNYGTNFSLKKYNSLIWKYLHLCSTKSS
jgi:hypothetical protein